MTNVTRFPGAPAAVDGDGFGRDATHMHRITDAGVSHGPTDGNGGSHGALPPPIAPDWLDVRHLKAMLVDIDMLLNSETWGMASGDEAKAAMTLWAKSFHQVPAGTLPANDRVLAAWSMVSPEKWNEIKDVALRGFVLCSDGRLHHRIVIDKAIEAHEASSRFRRAAEARWASHKDSKENQSLNATHPRRTSNAHATNHALQTEVEVRKDSTLSVERVVVSVENQGLSNSSQEAPQKRRAREARITRDAVDLWNEICAAAGCIPIRAELHEKRQKPLRARLAEMRWDLGQWREVCLKVAASAWCCGRAGDGRRSDIDWLTRPGNPDRVLEGAFDDRQRPPAPSAKPKPFRGPVLKG